MCVVDLGFVSYPQQTLKCLTEEAETQDLNSLDGYDQPLPPHLGSRVSGKSNVHVASNLNLTLVSAEVMARYVQAEEKLLKDLKPITIEDHQWHLRSLDQNIVGVNLSIKSWMLCMEWF